MKKSVIGIIIAVVALAGIVAVMAMSKKDKNPTSTTSSSSANPDGNTNGYAEDTSTTGNNPAADNTTPEATNTLSIKDFAFAPATITVKKGAVVTWTNNDTAPHTVTAKGESGPHSQTLNKGDTYTYTFNDAGAFDYFCELHPNMTAKVIVTE